MSYNSIIEKYHGMPNIQQFIEDRSYNINMDTFNRFWNNLNKKLPILIDDNLIEWIGYNNTVIKDRKRDMLKLLDSNGIPYETYKYNNLIEYIDNNPTLEIIKPEKTHSTIRKEFVIMTVKNFKKAMMMVNTERGKQVREYYINLEELLYDYMNLQLYYKENQLRLTNEKLDKLIDQNDKIKEELSEIKELNKDMNKKLDVTIEERSLKPINIQLWHKIIIIDLANLPDGHKYSTQDFYVIRAQRRSATSEYNKKYNECEIVFETEVYEGNAINMFIAIKNNFESKAKFFMNKVKINDGIDKNEFKEELVMFCNDIKEQFD